MLQRLLCPICTLLIFVISGQHACGQLFGDTSLNPNRRRKAAASELSTTVIEKFVRGSRRADDFVGAASPGQARFVGVGPADPAGQGAITSAVTGLREEAAPPVNVPRTRAAAGIYAPKLTVGFQYQRPVSQEQSSEPVRPSTVQNYAANRGLSLIVSPDGTTAHLQGAVDSAEKRQLAELIVLFEPGIETVVNDLSVESMEPR